MKLILTDKLPESEKTIILVEKEARLIQPSADSYLNSGIGIHFVDSSNYCYVKIKPEYTFSIPLIYFDASRQSSFNTPLGGGINGINGKTQNTIPQKQWYRLTQTDKARLIDINR
ncbi:hypothetical protein, partial [Gilliamella sp. Fer1-1]|uniref:hypothetical protein n=1 Tax=Gilliamella sp. Fer1-1 TaxID=3120240 RepID=UPI0011474570